MAEKKIRNEFDEEYRLVGIATTAREYKLCFYLNKLLDCDFRKLKDLSFQGKDRTRTVQFSVFKSGEEEDKNRFMVFSNKNLGEFLLPEANKFDFVLMLMGKFEEEYVHHLTEGVRSFPDTVLCAEIPLKRIRSRERLIYEEEKPARKMFGAKKFH